MEVYQFVHQPHPHETMMEEENLFFDIIQVFWLGYGKTNTNFELVLWIQ